MRRQGLGWLTAGLVVLAAASCFKDPTSSLRGSASRLVLSANFVSVSARPDTQIITIQAQDPQGNFKTFGAPTYVSVDPTIATMVAFPDTVIGTIPGNTLWKALLIGGAQFGVTKVAVTAAGVTDTISVLNAPAVFSGTILPATAQAGDTIVITAPAGLTFSGSATATETTPVAASIFLLGRTATTLRYGAAGPTAATTLSIAGLQLGAAAIPAVTSTATITVSGDRGEPGNNTSAGAINMGTIAKPGDSLIMVSAISGADAGSDASGNGADYYKFTMDTSGTVSVNLSFAGAGTPGNDVNPDLDVVICTTLVAGQCTYGNDIAGNAAAGSVNPESGTTTNIVATSAASVTVYVRIYGYFASAAGVTGYRLRVKTP